MKDGAMRTAIKAESESVTTVIYTYSDDSQEKWSGGDRNWRNRNPGNVDYNGIQWQGLIGHDSRFCIFSDAEYGKRATRKIISNRRAEGKTLKETIFSYAPPLENNTESYIGVLEKAMGFSRDKKLLFATDDQIERLLQGIFHHEGTRIGTVTIAKQKEGRKKGKYIWHTAQDEKVRTSHAQRNGKVFDFENPPSDGNPGEPSDVVVGLKLYLIKH